MVSWCDGVCALMCITYWNMCIIPRREQAVSNRELLTYKNKLSHQSFPWPMSMCSFMHVTFNARRSSCENVFSCACMTSKYEMEKASKKNVKSTETKGNRREKKCKIKSKKERKQKNIKILWVYYAAYAPLYKMLLQKCLDMYAK